MKRSYFARCRSFSLVCKGKIACMAAACLSLAIPSALGATLEQIEQIAPNWPGVELSLSLESGDKTDSVVFGDEVRYSLSGNQTGSCYLLHIDSHGNATLMKPDNCETATGSGEGFSTLFPTTDRLTVSAPLGQERIFAFLVDGSLPQSERILVDGQGFASLATQESFDVFANEIIAAGSSGRVARAELSYLVDANPDNVQFTTRGIIRKVVEGTDAKTLEKENVVAQFEVQNIQFAFGSAELTENGKTQLDAFGAALQSKELAGAALKLKLAGHTDDIGGEEYNQHLSEQRALAAKSYLKENYKIPDQQVNAEGQGESKPLAPNDSEENRALNRRVEILFVTQ